jgi:hypothetical protein
MQLQRCFAHPGRFLDMLAGDRRENRFHPLWLAIWKLMLGFFH